MEPFNIWESFDNSDDENEYDPIDDDNAFDEAFINRMRFKKGKRITANEVYRELGDFIQELSKSSKQTQDDWYQRFCKIMLTGKGKYYIEIEDIDVLEAAQEVATEGPNGDSYDDWIREFTLRDDDGYSLNEFFKVLDTMGYYKDQLELIDNPQDILDL